MECWSEQEMECLLSPLRHQDADVRAALLRALPSVDAQFQPLCLRLCVSTPPPLSRQLLRFHSLPSTGHLSPRCVRLTRVSLRLRQQETSERYQPSPTPSTTTRCLACERRPPPPCGCFAPTGTPWSTRWSIGSWVLLRVERSTQRCETRRPRRSRRLRCRRI